MRRNLTAWQQHQKKSRKKALEPFQSRLCCLYWWLWIPQKRTESGQPGTYVYVNICTVRNEAHLTMRGPHTALVGLVTEIDQCESSANKETEIGFLILGHKSPRMLLAQVRLLVLGLCYHCWLCREGLGLPLSGLAGRREG